MARKGRYDTRLIMVLWSANAPGGAAISADHEGGVLKIQHDMLDYLSSQTQSLPELLPHEMHQALAMARAAPDDMVRLWVSEGWVVDGVGAMLLNEDEVGVVWESSLWMEIK